MKAAPKAVSPILLFWPTTSEANVSTAAGVDDMAAQIEPSHEYSLTF